MAWFGIIRTMPPASDEVCRLLRRVFADTASNVVEFTRTARGVGHRCDEGLVALLPDMTFDQARDALKRAIVHFLDEGGKPNETHELGDPEMKLDPATFYEFRLTCEGRALYVKVKLDDTDPDEPTAQVVSVKRDDSKGGGQHG
ncbi:MAG: hypothetical protein L6R00_14900 [Phycisphaerae bacterium]|nr:hypothetical protein [Phycisphaerae bacterium]